MAERIQHRKEKSLAEYEQMRRMALFNDVELSAIKKQRDQHEQKIARQSKTPRFFTDYIEYEKNVMLMVEERRKSRKVTERYGIEKSIIRRITDLFHQAQRYFPHEIRFWEQHLKFCQQFEMNTEVSVILEQLLNYHGDKPNVWAKAINFEYKLNPSKSMERVRSYLLRAVQRHPENNELYLQYFRVELEEGQKMSDEDNSVELEKTNQRLVALYQNCKTKIHNIDFYVDLLNVCKEFPFAQKFDKTILKDMLEAFPCDPMLWNTLATRELEGLHMRDEDLEDESSSQFKQKQPLTNLKTRISLCIEIYERAVDILTKDDKIWTFYINTMLDLNMDRNPPDLLAFKRKALGNAFKKGHEVGKISELHYQQYVELLLEAKSYDLIEEVIEKATQLYPNSPKLWEIWMKVFMAQNDGVGVEKKFNEAKDRFPSAHRVEFFKLMLQFYLLKLDAPNKVHEIFQAAITDSCKEVSTHFQPEYIEWLALTRSIDTARKVYTDLTTDAPVCLELHQKMAKLEASLATPDIERWRKCHEFATQYFGKERFDVWIEFIKFEQNFGEPKKCTAIYERARSTLKTELVDNFVTSHSLISLI